MYSDSDLHPVSTRLHYDYTEHLQDQHFHTHGIMQVASKNEYRTPLHAKLPKYMFILETKGFVDSNTDKPKMTARAWYTYPTNTSLWEGKYRYKLKPIL